MAKFYISFNTKQIEKLNIGLIVEMWDKRKSGVRNRVAYDKTFTPAQQRILNNYHAKFAKWYLVTGIPNCVPMRPRTYTFLRNATNYFAHL